MSIDQRVQEASAAWTWISADAEVADADDYVLVRQPAWFQHPVELASVKATGRSAADVLDEALSTARGWGASYAVVWVRLDAPSGWEDAVRGRGGRPDETLDVLARPLAAGELPELSARDDVDVRWSLDLQTQRDGVRVGAEVFGGTVPADDVLEREVADHRADEREGRGGMAVAYVEGRPVGSAGLTVDRAHPGDARLWGGAVVEDMRGRGVYRALLDARLRRGLDRGCDLALVKGRVQTSGPILRRAGFDVFGQERSYLVDV